MKKQTPHKHCKTRSRYVNSLCILKVDRLQLARAALTQNRSFPLSFFYLRVSITTLLQLDRIGNGVCMNPSSFHGRTQTLSVAITKTNRYYKKHSSYKNKHLIPLTYRRISNELHRVQESATGTREAGQGDTGSDQWNPHCLSFPPSTPSTTALIQMGGDRGVERPSEQNCCTLPVDVRGRRRKTILQQTTVLRS